MHHCLTLSNVGGHWYLERELSGLIAGLKASSDSIDSCDIDVQGPSGEGAARHWRVTLKLRIFNDIVRATTRLPEGADPAQSLSRVLADIYARSTAQIAHIAEQHYGRCTQCAEYAESRSKAFA
jgi:hypothetical protein